MTMTNLLMMWAKAGRIADKIMKEDPTIPRAVACSMAMNQIKKEEENDC